MSDPSEISNEEAVARLQLDISLEDFDFLKRFARYRNALARVQEKKLKLAWSRKSLAESLLAAQISLLRGQLAAVFEAVGPLPDAEDRDGMDRYAKRVLAWDKKLSK